MGVAFKDLLQKALSGVQLSFFQWMCNSPRPTKKIWLSVFFLGIFIGCYIFPGRAVQAQSKPLKLQGNVKDQFGGVLVGAQVTVRDANAESLTSSTDQQGVFQFDILKPGVYTLSITVEGFSNYQTDLSLNESKPIYTINITLSPTVEEKLSVSGGEKSVSLDPQSAAGSQVLNQEDLNALPDDPDQLREQLELLATSSGSASGQSTVTVDGFKIAGRLPPKSAIKTVRINPDLYSAEYDKAPYRGGRIEIETRPGATAFHGSGFFNYNNSILNARDAFSPQRPSTNTQWYGFELGGPIIKKKVGFLASFEARNITESSSVNAIVLDKNFNPAPFATNVATPLRLLSGSGRLDWQVNKTSSLIFRYDINDNKLNNQGVGGFNLAETGFNSQIREQGFRLSWNGVISNRFFNEARLGITRASLENKSLSNSPMIIVSGFFTSGGGNLQHQRQDDFKIEVADSLFYAVNKHRLKFGTQIYGDSIDQIDTGNFNGLFTFGGRVAPELDAEGHIVSGPTGPVQENITGLEQYRRALLGLPGGVATRFAISSGNPGERLSTWTLGLFVQDEWSVRKNLLLSLGLRSESQTNPGDRVSLAPRIGIAYAPDKKQEWILRARAGIFYDRIPETLPLELIRFDGVHVSQLLVDSPSFPAPFQGGTISAPVSTIRSIEDGITPPMSLQYQFGFEHKLPHGWNMDFSHSFARTWHNLRSRNINAPFASPATDPQTAPRPNGVDENILLFESSGRVKGQVTVLGVRGNIKWFSLNVRYLHFNYHNDTDNLFTLPQSSYDLTGEWARPSWQSRNRMFMTVGGNLPGKLYSSVTFSAAEGTPFNITTGQDNNGDGSFTDRPSLVDIGAPSAIKTRFGALDPAVINGNIPRNFGTNPARINMDADITWTFFPGKGVGGKKENRYKAAIGMHMSNLLNHTNVTGLNGVLTSPFFGFANTAFAGRHVEIGLRFSF